MIKGITNWCRTIKCLNFRYFYTFTCL